MNKKQLILVFFALSLSAPAYSSIPEIDYATQSPPTEQQLKDLAIEKGIVPYSAGDVYLRDQTKQKNTVIAWILLEREQKIEIIDNLKKMFKDKSKVTIKLSSSYYVDEMNGVMFNSIKSGDIDETNKRGIGIMFRTIAMMDGDFDYGQKRVEELKEYMGDEIFSYYKKQYPEKYERLIKLDKQGD